MQKWIVDDLDALVNTFPPYIQERLRQREDITDLLEVVLDLGRVPTARFPHGEVALGEQEVTEEAIQHVVQQIGAFGDDNRAGIPRTLHRISAIRSRTGKIVGLTCRVGRAVFGTIKIIEDMVLSGKSVLLLGRPGVGKTTMLREVARVLADDANKRVVIVDTSNEIAGDGDIPHPAIGKARRMQVRTPTLQHAVMIEAVENHMPEVIVIDEMGTDLEAAAARTIAERGVQLIATAHGNTLDNLVMNPTLSDLVGGVQTVTLGDEEARRRRSQKTILERKAPPTFDSVVEIQSWDKVAVHVDVAKVVDAMLRGYPVFPEVRSVDKSGKIYRSQEAPQKVTTARRPEPATAPSIGIGGTRIHPFGVNRGTLEQVARGIRAPVQIVDSVDEADMLLTTKSYYRRRPETLRVAEEEGKPVYVLRRNTPSQMEQFLQTIASGNGGGNRMGQAMKEAEEAVQHVMAGEGPVELNPQGAYIRRLQHQLAQRYQLESASSGMGPHRRVTIYKP